MASIINRLYNSSPKEIVRKIRARLGLTKVPSAADRKAQAAAEQLREKFSVYQTSALHKIGKDEFVQHIQSRIGVIDPGSEGYSESELDKQRDFSVKFTWGHNHDFGDFKLNGQMGDRHINMLANFIGMFPISIEDFKDKWAFDIGCWTGGTSLLLAALGSNVWAVEEIKKYADMATFLARSFGLEKQISVHSKSLYECKSEEYHDRFDIVFIPGVMYHVSDPVLALRILFNSLKPGGVILIESAGLNSDEPYCLFAGNQIHRRGSKDDMNRTGWNWYFPSPSALDRMLVEAGFDEIDSRWHYGTDRVYAYAKKISQVGITKAGLSVQNIR